MAFDAGAVVGRVDLKTGNFIINSNKITKAGAGMKKSMLGAQIQFALLERAIGAVTGFLKGSTEAWAKQEEAIAQTEARIRSTGGAAGLTTKDIINLSNAMQEQTTYADDDVQAMNNLLLTFTNIRGETFKGATEIILDMSTALGQDLKSSAVQVGKALQDPILGVTALRRVGVNLTEQQKDLINQLMRAGKVEEAQAVILKELQTEFGGAARASKETFGGAMKSLENDVGDLKESIGKALAPVIVDFSKILQPAVKWLQNIDENTVRLALSFGGLIVTTYAVGKAVTALSNMLKAGITPLQGVLMALAAVGAVVTVVNEAMARARTIHGELAEAYVKEYEAIDGQVSRYNELRNKANLSLREKNELIKVAGTLKQQLGEESAFIQDQSGKWVVNANSVQKYKKERLELAVRELRAQKKVDEAEKKWAKERMAFFEEFKRRVSKGYITELDKIWIGANKVRYGFGLLDDATKMELFTLQELNRTTDKLATTEGQLEALTQGNVAAYKSYTLEGNKNTTGKLQNTIVTDQMIQKEKELSELLHENALEFMTDKEREIQALKDRLQMMSDAGASAASIDEYYNKKLAQINEKYADEAAKSWENTASRISESFGAVVRPAQMAMDAITGVWSQALANEQTALDNDYARKKERIEKNVADEEQRQAKLEELEAEYAEKQRELKKKQWVADKAANLTRAIMNTAQAVVSALAVFPPWLGISLAATVGAMGAVQIGLIAAQEMPEFARGGDPLAGSFGLVGEEGPEIVHFPKAAHVYTAQESREMIGRAGDFNVTFTGDIRSDVDIMRQMQIADAQYRARQRGVA